MTKKYVLKKDVIFPKGTVFENIDGSQRDFVLGNYESLIRLTDDTFGQFVYNIDEDDQNTKEWFEEVE